MNTYGAESSRTLFIDENGKMKLGFTEPLFRETPNFFNNTTILPSCSKYLNKKILDISRVLSIFPASFEYLNSYGDRCHLIKVQNNYYIVKFKSKDFPNTMIYEAIVKKIPTNLYIDHANVRYYANTRKFINKSTIFECYSENSARKIISTIPIMKQLIYDTYKNYYCIDISQLIGRFCILHFNRLLAKNLDKNMVSHYESWNGTIIDLYEKKIIYHDIKEPQGICDNIQLTENGFNVSVPQNNFELFVPVDKSIPIGQSDISKPGRYIIFNRFSDSLVIKIIKLAVKINGEYKSWIFYMNSTKLITSASYFGKHSPIFSEYIEHCGIPTSIDTLNKMYDPNLPYSDKIYCFSAIHESLVYSSRKIIKSPHCYFIGQYHSPYIKNTYDTSFIDSTFNKNPFNMINETDYDGNSICIVSPKNLSVEETNKMLNEGFYSYKDGTLNCGEQISVNFVETNIMGITSMLSTKKYFSLNNFIRQLNRNNDNNIFHCFMTHILSYRFIFSEDPTTFFSNLSQIKYQKIDFLTEQELYQIHSTHGIILLNPSTLTDTQYFEKYFNCPEKYDNLNTLLWLNFIGLLTPFFQYFAIDFLKQYNEIKCNALNFFREKLQNPHFYMRKLRPTDNRNIHQFIKNVDNLSSKHDKPIIDSIYEIINTPNYDREYIKININDILYHMKPSN